MNGSPASSCSVLIVEDETLLRMMITEMLEELGHRVAAEAARLEQALPLAQSADFDLAVLDVNIAGQLITPVAELIAARRRPIIFATGYRPGYARFLEPGIQPDRSGVTPKASDLGLYLVGFHNAVTGLLREIGIEAQAIADDIRHRLNRKKASEILPV